MSRYDRLAAPGAALLLSFLAVLAAYFVADQVYERMPHLEDELAYVWQAQALAGGHLTLPSPPQPDNFLVPFVVDHDGRRFGKYPPGWPLLLALGVLSGARAWVNPLLAGLGVWLTYRLGRKIFSPGVGLLAAGLTLTSPYFLLNSGSLLSHPFGLALSAGFVLAWLEAFESPRAPRSWLPALAAGLALGTLALTRPLTAVGVGLPFALHGLWLLARGDSLTRRRVLVVGLVGLGIGALLFLWQYDLTGDPLRNPYTLWWPYDRVGFGPGIGVRPGGHSLNQAVINTRESLEGGFRDLFGWWSFSLLFVPLGLVEALRRLRQHKVGALLAGGVFPALVLVYMAYWVGSNLYGPRYYYEGLYSLTLLTAAGAGWLAGRAPALHLPDWLERRLPRLATGVRFRRLRVFLVGALLVFLVGANLLTYLPSRLGGMYSLYTINRVRLAPFLAPGVQRLAPALVIVHPQRWMPYGALLELQTPFLDSPFIFAVSRGPEPDAALQAAFPGRRVIQYNPAEPYRFTIQP